MQQESSKAFRLVRDENKLQTHTTPAMDLAATSPAATAPMMMMPAAMPMAVMPAVMAVPVPMPVMAPSHLFRLQLIDVRLRNHGGLSARAIGALRRGNRRQWRGLRACGERGCTSHESNGDFEKVPTF